MKSCNSEIKEEIQVDKINKINQGLINKFFANLRLAFSRYIIFKPDPKPMTIDDLKYPDKYK